MTDVLPFAPDLFDLLVCPESRKPLKLVGKRLISTCPNTRRAYRIDDGIPVMLIEESHVIEQAEWQRLMAGDGPIGAGVAAVQARHR